MMGELKPIRSEEDHASALVEMQRLWGAKLGTPEGDRLDILATLVDAYEAEHHAIDPIDPVEAILFRMEQSGRVQSDLASIVEPTTSPVDLLDRRAELSLEQIRRLHDEWGISAEVLIRPFRSRDAA